MVERIPMERRGHAIADVDVVRFEERIGATLPSEYRRFLLTVNGGRPALETSVITLGRSETVINTLNSLDDEDEDRDLFSLYEWGLEASGLPTPDLLQIGSCTHGPVALCIRGAQYGEVWVLDTGDPRPEDANPRVLWHDRRDMHRIATSFGEFIASLRPDQPAI